MSEGSSHLISALVGQLKAGKITKTELMTEIAKLRDANARAVAQVDATLDKVESDRRPPQKLHISEDVVQDVQKKLDEASLYANSKAPEQATLYEATSYAHQTPLEDSNSYEDSNLYNYNSNSAASPSLAELTSMAAARREDAVRKLVQARRAAHAAQASVSSNGVQDTQHSLHETQEQNPPPTEGAGQLRVRGTDELLFANAAPSYLPPTFDVTPPPPPPPATKSLLGVESGGREHSSGNRDPFEDSFVSSSSFDYHSIRRESAETEGAAARQPSRRRGRRGSLQNARRRGRSAPTGRKPSSARRGNTIGSGSPASFGSRTRDDFAGHYGPGMEYNPAGEALRRSRYLSEAAIRQDIMKECTFTPEIRTLPRSYGNSRLESKNRASFHVRAMQWQEEMEANWRQKVEDWWDSEMQKCPFQPKISPASIKKVNARRSKLKRATSAPDPDVHMPPHVVNDRRCSSPIAKSPSRLRFGKDKQSAKQPQAKKEPARTLRSEDLGFLSAGDRLYKEYEVREMRHNMAEARARAEDEERWQRECSFQPDTSVSRMSLRSARKTAHLQFKEFERTGGGATLLDREAEGYEEGKYDHPQEAASPSESRRRQRSYSAPPARRRYAVENGVRRKPWNAGPGEEGYSVSAHRLGMDPSRAVPHESVSTLASGALGETPVRPPVYFDGESIKWRRTSSRTRRIGLDESSREEPTFTPLVKGPSKHMKNARAYLSENVVDRLTRTPTVGDESHATGLVRSEPKFDDYDAFVSGLGNGRQATLEAYVDETELHSESKDVRDAETRRQAFHEFLARQQAQLNRKERKIEANIVRETPTFRPKLCSGTEAYLETTQQGAFLDRLAAQEIKRRQDEIRARARAKDPEATFAPNITKKSAAREPRSFYNLSRGDYVTQVTNRRRLKLRVEAQELREATFQPKFSTRKGPMRQVGSKLNVVSDPDGYVKRVQREAQRRQQQVLKHKTEKEQKALMECTFNPETTSCPSYVRRIAESMRTARHKQMQHTQSDYEYARKAEWR